MANELYGDGSDGSQTFSSNGSLSNGVYQYTDVTIQSGVTVTTERVVIHATNSITIDGTLDATGGGAAGGSGAQDTSDTETDGEDGFYEGAGGNSGLSSATGGTAANTVPTDLQDIEGRGEYNGNDPEWGAVYSLPTNMAGSGGGGGGTNDNAYDGGPGGDGGGVIVLVAPSISVTGSAICDGANGANASGGGGTTTDGAGGGGGGSGGVIWTVTEGDHPETSVLSVAGGAGGDGIGDQGDPGGGGDPGAIYQLDTIIGAPDNLTVTDDTVEDQLTLGWDAVADADEYRLYRATSSGTDLADYTQVATITDGTQTQYTDTGLPDGDEFFYRLVAVDTDKQVLVSWGTEADWDAATTTDISVVGGTFELATVIPDSGDLQARWDATELSLSHSDPVSTLSDETGNGHDLTQGTASAQPTYIADGINGNPVVRFNGVDQFLDVAFSALSQPNHIFAVVQWQAFDDTAIEDFYDGDTSSGRNELQQSNGDWTIFAGGAQISGSAVDTNPHITAALFNGGSSVLRVDGVDDATGDPGGNPLDGFQVGSNFTDGSFGEVDVGEILIYPQDKSGIQGDVESYLSDKWGITI